MPTDLHELLDDVAARAPLPDTRAIWQAGRRRARRRTALAGAVAGLTVLLGVLVVGAALRGPDELPDIGPVQTPGVDDQPTPPATSGPIGVATLVDDRTVLQRSDGSRQQLPELVVGEAVMLRDGTFVYEAHPPMERLVGDPPLWAVPPTGDPVLLDEGTEEPGTRRLVGRDETGELTMVRVAGGDLEVWDVHGERIPVGGGTELTTMPADWLLSRYGFDLAFAMPGDRRVMLRSRGARHEVDVTDHDGGVVTLGHTPTDLVVLVTGGESGPEIVVLDPSTGEVRARHGVPGAEGSTEVVGMSVTDGTVAVHRRVAGTEAGGWLPGAILDLTAERWTDAATRGPAYLVGPPTPPVEARQGIPDGLTTTTMVMDPEAGGGIARALQRADGTRQELPGPSTPVGGVMLADGTFVHEAVDFEAGAAPEGAASPLWALPPDGEPLLLDEGRAARQLVGQAPGGTAVLVLTDGTSLQRWSPDGDRVEVDSLAGLDASSALSVGMVAVTEQGALAVQYGTTRVTVRSGPEVDARQVAVTQGDQAIRAVLAVAGQLVVVVDDDAAASPAEVVVLDAATGQVAERLEVPGTSAGDTRAVSASAHAGWVAVHMVEAAGGASEEWRPTALLDLQAHAWFSVPAPGRGGQSLGPAHPHTG